jgi:hypothetical protein
MMIFGPAGAQMEAQCAKTDVTGSECDGPDGIVSVGA